MTKIKQLKRKSMNSKTNEFLEFNVLVLDDEITKVREDIFKNLASYEYNQINYRFNFEFSDNPSELIKNLTFSKKKFDAVLLDINFNKLGDDKLKEFNYLELDKSRLGVIILKIIKRIDPTIPVLMFTIVTDPSLAATTGRYQADDFITKIQIEKYELDMLCKKLYYCWRKCKENPIYDIEHLDIADKYAKDYDKDEQEKVATIAYLHYENEIIKNEIKYLLDTNTDKIINILDLGCGTGRIESLIEGEFDNEQKQRISVVAVDFSGKMLFALNQKNIHLPNLQILRSPAEMLCAYGTELEESSFDFIIAGFGFCSYVNYKAILLPHKGRYGGLAALVKPGHKILFSVYNEDSLLYDRITRNLTDDYPIAAWVDLDEGILNIPGHKVIAEAFNLNTFKRLVHQAGLKILEDQMTTFPTLHISLNNSECDIEPGFILGGDSLFKDGRFNKALYDLDVTHSLHLKNKGHYIITMAFRPME